MAQALAHAVETRDEAGFSWDEQLARLRRRADALRATGPMADPLRRAEGEQDFARLRAAARALFEPTIAAYRDLCPEGYPHIDDNGIESTGGSVGIRFTEHHSFFFTFERVRRKKKKNKEEELQGLAGALGIVPKKRMPGDPLPPQDPDEPVRLAMIALRYDEHSGWAEMHRPLDPRWDEGLLREHLAAFLVGLGYDVTVAAQVKGELDAEEGPTEAAEAAEAPIDESPLAAAARRGWHMQTLEES